MNDSVVERKILADLIANVAVLGKEPERALLGLRELYGENLRYENPIQRVEGREAFLRLMGHMATKWAPFSMQIDEGVVDSGRIYGRFFLSFRPGFLGRAMNIEGVTRCVVKDQVIVEQRDFYDAVSAALDVVPLAGPTFRKIISKFTIE